MLVLSLFVVVVGFVVAKLSKAAAADPSTSLKAASLLKGFLKK